MTRTEIIKAVIIAVVILAIVASASFVYFKLKNNEVEKPRRDVNNNRGTDLPVVNNLDDDIIDKKPVIYLYPNVETEVSVKLGNSENITHSYPKYIDGWNVIAKPDGTLIDIDTKRELYSLYYESKNVYEYKVEDNGFVVKGEDTISFLEKKLEILGLNAKEAEEFIIYWLPQLENNKYNYIRFATEDEIEENMPIEYSVKPESEIRILMTYKPLDKEIEVKEQELTTPQRTGFTVVEWGGTRIK